MRSMLRTAFGLTAILCLAGCGEGKPTVTIKGSDTMVILGQRWAEEYGKKNNSVKIQVNGGGSGVGIAALIDGATDICAASRPMKDKERADVKAKFNKDVTEIPVALDGLAIFLSMNNPIDELSLAQLDGIYRGKITDWKDVGGKPGKIVCYGRENSSGTFQYFKEHVLKNENFATEVQSLPGTAAVINAVSKDEKSIGYGGIGYAKEVKVIRVKNTDSSKAIEPSLATVVSGEYPISRKLFFYLAGEPKGDAKAFIDWCLSDEGQKICEQVGYFPIPKK